MRKLIMWNVVTLDGYFEGEKAWDLDFHQYAWGKELEEFIDTQLATVDMLVYGENTYKGMYDYWSKEEGKTAEKLNAVPKIVCSRTLEKADWNNTKVVKDAVTEISKLKKEGEGNMFVFGSAKLSESLMKADLFDEYRLCVSPVLLGKGTLLFKEGIPMQKLKLLEARPLDSGAVILRYGVK
jgi:dihydrofolate reductase